MKIKFLSLFILVGVVFLMIATPIIAQSTQVVLSTEEENVELGSQLSVKVNVISERNTLGTDLVVKFDPEIISLKEVTPGDVYTEFSNTTNSLIKWNKEGIIHLSGISDFNKGVVPNGLMTTFEFNAIKVGSTDIEILYDSSDSTLTGVIPFDGNEANLLAQSPEILSIEVTSNNWWQEALIFIKNLFI